MQDADGRAGDGPVGSPPAVVPPSPFGRVELALGLGFWAVAMVTAAVVGVLDAALPYLWAPVLLVLVWPVLRRARHGLVVADWIGFPLVVVTYEMLHRVVPACWAGTIDPWLVRADDWLLGTRVADYFDPIVTPATTVVFACFYASYYLLPVSLGVRWYRRIGAHASGRTAFRELMVGEAGALFIGYLGYLYLPAIGPHAFLTFAEPLQGNFIGEWIVSLNAAHGGEYPRDAFPSLHTANAVTILLVAWKHERRVLAVYGPLVAGLIVATMYLRFHYLVDVVAGAGLAVAWQCVVPRLVAWEEGRGTDSVRP